MWVHPRANRTTAPVAAMHGWYKRPDYQTCIGYDRKRLTESHKGNNMLRVRGKWREKYYDKWTDYVC